MQQQILDMLLKRDEITWQNILYDLVKTEQMDPWDIDISLLTHKYLEIIRKLQETDFFISGKVVLAASILLKIKSDKLLTENIANFDNLLFNQEVEELDDFEIKNKRVKLMENPRLTIRNPQARKKRVSLNDLVGALEKALEVNQRRTIRRMRVSRINIEIPIKKFDLGAKLKEIYGILVGLFSKKEKVTFTELVGSERKEDKLTTFVPLLHLADSKKVTLEQETHFGEIDIRKFS